MFIFFDGRRRVFLVIIVFFNVCRSYQIEGGEVGSSENFRVDLPLDDTTLRDHGWTPDKRMFV